MSLSGVIYLKLAGTAVKRAFFFIFPDIDAML
jgi:hypothetical protein